MDFFVERPERAFIVALAFGFCFLAAALSRAKPAWPLALPAAAWLAYGTWEQHLRGKGHNIRVDLLLIYPVLGAITLAGLVLHPMLNQRTRIRKARADQKTS